MIRPWGENRWLVLDALAIVTGLAGGLGAVIFRRLAEAVHHHLFFGQVLAALPGGDGRLAFLPVLGGLVIGLSILRLAPEAGGGDPGADGVAPQARRQDQGPVGARPPHRINRHHRERRERRPGLAHRTDRGLLRVSPGAEADAIIAYEMAAERVGKESQR